MNFRIVCLLALIVSSECASLFQAKNLITKPKTVKIEFRMINDSDGGLKLLPIGVENFKNRDNKILDRNLELKTDNFDFPERFESINQVGHDLTTNSIDDQIGDEISYSDEESAKTYMVPKLKIYQ